MDGPYASDAVYLSFCYGFSYVRADMSEIFDFFIVIHFPYKLQNEICLKSKIALHGWCVCAKCCIAMVLLWLFIGEGRHE